ncbi:hypothetical protein OCU04_005934 [Sclerotinia nivalis]|uniref:Thioester reductase (TE) domain-containing protein n=1 Tax=Sclerotinia nivalis TaxID=352851 RepID=A0A9X0AMW0_9HELO|nr:hypothetical protein OCU04_005934 [Sclerotinia nivalis]
MLRNEIISHIYCLNRGSDARERQESLLVRRGVPQYHFSKLHYMTVGIGALKLGYAESRCVAESILAAANQNSNIPVTILRVGQVGGSTNANDPPWPKQEWLYPVLKASKSLGLIASKLTPVD